MRYLEIAFVPPITFLIVASSTNTARSCFYPSSDPRPDDPCDPDDTFSMCCPPPAVSLPSGLCLHPYPGPDGNTRYPRGSYRLPPIYCCELDLEKARCCRTASLLSKLCARTFNHPASTSSASTLACSSSSLSPMPSKLPATLTSRTPLLSHSTLSVTSLDASLITPHLAPSTQSLTSSLTSSFAASMLSSSRGQTPPASVIGVVLGGIALLGIVIGGLWLWTKFRRTQTYTGGTGCCKPEFLHSKCWVFLIIAPRAHPRDRWWYQKHTRTPSLRSL